MIFQEIIAENLQEVFLAFLNNIYSYFSVTATIINLSLEHYLVMQLISFVLVSISHLLKLLNYPLEIIFTFFVMRLSNCSYTNVVKKNLNKPKQFFF